jgi:urease accessory protein
MKRSARLVLLAAGLAVGGAAWAHPLPSGAAGLGAGLAHPLSGLDHLLAMIGAGIWAAQLGGRARWLVPLAFVSSMAGGMGLALAGIALPHVESGIVASVMVIGVLVASAARLPAAVGAALIALFGVFHGHAHGSEGIGFSTLEYMAGVLLATGLLLVAGIALADAARRRSLADEHAAMRAAAARLREDAPEPVQ